MSTLVRSALLCVPLWCAACGGGGAIEGSLSGTSFQMAGGFSVPVGDGAASALQLVFTDRGNLCAQGELDGARAVVIQLAIVSPDGSGELALVPGRYDISARGASSAAAGQKFALVGAFDFRNGCVTSGPLALSGTVQIHHLELGADGLPSRLVGEMDAQFLAAEHLAGSFDVQACAQPRLHQTSCH